MQGVQAIAPKPTKPLPAYLKPLWEKQKAKLLISKTVIKPKSFKVSRLNTKQRVARRRQKKARLAESIQV
jgi:hypothetical protein